MKKRGAMIQGSTASGQTADWQAELKSLTTNPADLIQALDLDPSHHDLLDLASPFPLRVPRDFLQRIARGSINDPLLRQILPVPEEKQFEPGYSTDPVGEQERNTVPGLIHKYKGRVLLIVSSSCPIHCRYCFRREFPYENNRISRQDWEGPLDYIQRSGDIREVILSGGDPLSVPDHHLAWLIEHLDGIRHLKRLRIHTRFPVVIPSRITDGLIEILTTTRLTPSVVIHCNHPDEISPAVFSALERLRGAGISLFNQSVLLRGVNDDATTLVALSEKLFEAGVTPYYLHLLDRVQGAAHFEVPEAEAQKLHLALQAELPGYLVPRLVREESGMPAKTLKSP